MKIKCNTFLGTGFEEGKVVNVPDNNGVPMSKFWRRRLADAVEDDSCEVVVDNEVSDE